MNLCLGMALRVVLWYGRAIFDARDLRKERNDLAGMLQEGFPGDQFNFWMSEKGLSDRPRLEGDALLEALRNLVAKQVHRLRHSGSLQANLLLYFRGLYRKALLARVSESEVPSPWLLAEDAKADKQVYRSWQEGSDADQADESEPYNLSSAVPADDEATLADPEQVGVVAVELHVRMMDFLRSLGQVQRTQGFPLGELRAVTKAMKAIFGGACYPPGGKHRNPFSQYLSEAEMRALRRACKRYDQIAPFLTNLSRWVANVNERLPRQGSQPREGMKRRRVGNIFLEMAEQAEEGGYTRTAAGARARNKWEWGQRLTEEDYELMTKDAAEWVLRVYRPSLLANLPDDQAVCERILREGSTGAAAEFARQALSLALACWPQGAAASFPPEPSPDSSAAG
jgi:hypothetical protein